MCLAAVLAYANTLSGEFVWDDVSSVLLHEDVQVPSRFAELFKKDLHCYAGGQGNFYRPLLAATFMLDFALSGGHVPEPEREGAKAVAEVSPFLFHVSSIAWHLAAALLLLALLTRLDAPRFVSFVVPLLYVLHPLHTEAVAYISGRADQMAGAFMFAGLWFAVWEGTPAKRIAGTALTVLCFVCGLLSKEAAFIFPALLLLVVLVAPSRLEGETEKRFVPGRFISLGLSIVVVGIYAALRATVLNFGSDSVAPDTGIGQRLIEVMQSFALYVKLLFVPTGLHMERTLAGVSTGVAGVGALLLAAAIGLIVFGVVRKQWRVAAGMAWFLVTWFPISGIFPLNAPMAEHWMYVPMAGFIWALAELLAPVYASNRLRPVVVGAVYAAAVFFLVLTIQRNWDWRSNEALYLATLKDNPYTKRIHYNLAVTYEDIDGNLPGARRHYERIIEICKAQKPQSSQGAEGEAFWDEELGSHMALGRIFIQEQDYRKALEHFSVFLRLDQNEQNREQIGTACLGMGQCLLALGDVQRAAQFFEKAIQNRPELKDAVRQMVGGMMAPATS